MVDMDGRKPGASPNPVLGHSSPDAEKRKARHERALQLIRELVKEEGIKAAESLLAEAVWDAEGGSTHRSGP